MKSKTIKLLGTLSLMALLFACGGKEESSTPSSVTPSQNSSSVNPTTSQEPTTSETPTTSEDTSSVESSSTAGEVETAFTPITTPVAGEYYMAMKCKDDVYWYLKGGMDGYYMATSDNKADAVKVTLAQDEDGWTLKQGDKFMEMETSGTHVNAVYKDVQTSGKNWAWDATYQIFTWMEETEKYFYGTYGNYHTIGTGKYSEHVSSNYKAQLGTFE